MSPLRAGSRPQEFRVKSTTPPPLVLVHYAEHGRAFPTRVRSAGLLGDLTITHSGRYALRTLPEELIHKSGALLVFERALAHSDEHVIKLTDTALDVGDGPALTAALRSMELSAPLG